MYDDTPEFDPSLIVQIAEHPNLATELSDAQLGQIGVEVVQMHGLDYSSMSDWRDRMKKGVELATLVKEKKSYPFENAANVKYPLVTTAALQFNARAYPAVVPSTEVVKVKTHGADPAGQKAARAERVQSHMSWQLLSQIEEWESETDKLLVQLPIVGTMFRKVWYDPVKGRQCCRVIDPGKLVINDKVTSLEDAPRMGEEISLYPYEIKSRVRSGQFVDADYFNPEDNDTQSPEVFIEQHTRLDLDEDGYEEPYIVTVHKKTYKVARIVADFETQDVRANSQGVIAISRGSYFIDYHFLPSMDGGFLGTGLGLLLGDISETVNSIINMMMDAGHMASLGGGFLGANMRIKGGSQRFRPGEWKPMQATGGQIRESIVPMTFPGPDGTLFQLLGLLIEAAKEVSSTKDIMTGDTGTKNMTATTTIALIEQGMMVFTAAYKRIFRSLKCEFKIIARNNAQHTSPEEYADFHDIQQQPDQTGHNGGPPIDPASDYSAADLDIEPVADPRSVTKMQEAAKAEFVLNLAGQGLLNPEGATRRMLEAMSIGNVDELLPQPDPMQQAMAMMQAQAAEADLILKQISIDQALADIEETRSKSIKNMSDAEATAYGAQMDETKLKLEALRAGIDASLRASAQRMEIGPGNEIPAMRSQQVPDGAGGSMQGVILPGQAMV
jgi:chaperonin GroES